jgi:hypothetical protein
MSYRWTRKLYFAAGLLVGFIWGTTGWIGLILGLLLAVAIYLFLPAGRWENKEREIR